MISPVLSLKGTQAWEFFGSDFEFFTFLWLVMPNYHFQENIFFYSTNIREATIIPQILSIAERGFSCKLGEKMFSQKT
jgi:hypothetical protein